MNRNTKLNAKNNNTVRKTRIKANMVRRQRRRISKLTRQMRIIRRQRRANNRIRLPAAITTSVPKTFNTVQQNGTTATVAGTDLIYKIPSAISSGSTSQVITVIPANPAYWTGTRIAAIASAYQNYRPVVFKVHYVPQCAVTQQGNVLAGTLWNEVPTEDNLQQTLKTSNGGILTQCYKPATSTVRMRTNLQYNLYRMGGDINQQSNPFIFIAMQIGCLNANNQSIVPGYFYITYKYILKNPIGTGVTYRNLGLTNITTLNTFQANAVAYACSNLSVNNNIIPTGTRLDIEKGETTYNIYYNNTLIAKQSDMPPTLTYWILENQPVQNAISQRAAFKTPIYYYGVVTNLDYELPLDPGQIASYESDNYIITLINVAQESANINIPSTISYTTKTYPQDFGPMTTIADDILVFEAPKTQYYLQLQIPERQLEWPIKMKDHMLNLIKQQEDKINNADSMQDHQVQDSEEDEKDENYNDMDEPVDTNKMTPTQKTNYELTLKLNSPHTGYKHTTVDHDDESDDGLYEPDQDVVNRQLDANGEEH